MNQINQAGRLSSFAATIAAGLLLSQAGAFALSQGSSEQLQDSFDSGLTSKTVLSEDLSAKFNDGLELGNVPAPLKIASTETLELESFSAAIQSDNLGQVTSVSQLSDVQPTDWAFQALQSLVERYGCIAGYPDGTFRGNRSATRYEMAAALNACLDNISDKFATKEDLEAVKALQEEFQAELATLRGRVDGLEARTDTLEAQQFSTTTKLQADAVILGQFGDTEDGLEARATAIASVYMSFNTSFSGDDLLQTTLSFGNGGGDTISTAGLGTTDTFTGGGLDVDAPLFNPSFNYFQGNGVNAFLYRLAYDFKPTEDLTIKVAPVFYPTDVIDANSYTSPFSGFSTWYSINNPLITPFLFNFAGGAGGAAVWNPGGGPITARAVYVAPTGNLSTDDPALPGGNGLFGSPYQATGELEFADEFGGGNNDFALRLQYSRTEQNELEQHVLGFNGEVTFGKFGLFGRYGYSFADGNGAVNPVPLSTAGGLGEFNIQTFQAGAGINDLIIPGSLLAASVGSPFIISDDDLGGAEAGVNDATQYNIEAFYRIPVSDNISVSPIFQAIINPNNSADAPNIYQGLIRTVFSF